MGRRAQRSEADVLRTRIRDAVILFVVVLSIAIMALPRHASGPHVPFARTVLPGQAGTERPFVVQFTPDGHQVLVVSRDALRAYVPEDLVRGTSTPLFTLERSETGVTFEGAYGAAVSGNGRELAIVRRVSPGAGSKDSELEVVAIKNGLLVERIPLETVTALALSENGMRALVGTSRAELWDLTGGTRVAALEVDGSPVSRMHFSPDERRAVFAQPAKARTLTWDLASQTTHEAKVALAQAIFTSDAGRVLGLAPGSATLWESERGAQTALDAGGQSFGEVADVALLSDGKRAVGVADQQVLVWDLESRKLVSVRSGAKPEIGQFTCLAVDPHQDSVVIGTTKGELLWLDLDAPH